ncbi:DNA topoisomerase [Eubacterium ventriosum]|uniref:DNA topoisomerase n=1 Tax=Eubacterium ventriosum TaxID=39496 RepID=UPI0039F50FC3
MKAVFIAEKPSVAAEFAKALKLKTTRRDGYMESENAIVTWCVGHLVTMSYPECYDEKYKKWNLRDLPFIPQGQWKYEVIPGVKKQFNIVKEILNRDDVDTIYVCTDSGREGEYIYRLVAQEAGVKGKKEKRVWIDSQTEEEILRGIKEAKDLKEYNNLSDAAYLRAKEDYLMGINFSRLLTLKYGNSITNYLKGEWKSINVGRVMTCVLGMVCNREREIRGFEKTPFYRVMAKTDIHGRKIDTEWKSQKTSKFFESPLLYKENGFKEKTTAQALIRALEENGNPLEMTIKSITMKDEKKQAPLLYNLAELQNDCSKMFKISPDETLNVVQQLYESKLVTYPRTDARVLSTAVAKEISKNISGLQYYQPCSAFAQNILKQQSYKNLAKTKYVDDKKITDHYAIIPTGQGLNGLAKQKPINQKVYMLIVRRFLSIFYPPAIYKKATLVGVMPATFSDGTTTTEHFSSNFKILAQKGYLEIAGVPSKKKATDNKTDNKSDKKTNEEKAKEELENENTINEEAELDEEFFKLLYNMSKGGKITVNEMSIKEGETTPPKRYTSGSIILAMENAGQLIEDEDLRAQIKGSGIGTSATRAEIIKKLVNIKYISLNKKTQVITPTQLGEMIFGVVHGSIKSLLNPELTASWELGLTQVAEGKITSEEYMKKLDDFIRGRFNNVINLNNAGQMTNYYNYVSQFYRRNNK